jgi:hypothetical protein
VPFIFDAARRQATKNAGQIAGIRVLDIIDEPVAGALAYAHKLLQAGGQEAWEMTEFFGDRIILVYDLGGGTFDLTLMRVKPDYTYEVLATAGDPRGQRGLGRRAEKLLVAKYIEVFQTIRRRCEHDAGPPPQSCGLPRSNPAGDHRTGQGDQTREPC